MNPGVIFAIVVVCGGVGLFFFFRLQLKIGKADIAEQVRRERIALRCNPSYAQMEERDRQYELAKERQDAEIALRQQQFQLSQYLAVTRVAPEQYLVDYEPTSITALPSLKRVQPEEQAAQNALGAGTFGPPTLDDLLSQIEENSLMVSPGIRQSNGEVVKVSIVDVPHLKIIGSTGFGKSCLAGAILDQATQLNSPDVLQLALLDLEHKTSRLFEDFPHIAELQVGKRRVSMVATNADEVAEHLGYLKMELARRAPLSEAELAREPVLLMYVEEMLSLQFEVDENLLDRMFADLTILSVRGRKYGMFLLACMQTDYSTKETRISQKMFRFRAAAAIDTKAANAAGFINTALIKENFSQGKPGQFVVEYPSFSDVVLAPRYDVKRLIAQKTRMNDPFSTRSAPFRDRSEEEPPRPFRVVNGRRTVSEPLVNDFANGDERAWQAKLERVRSLKELNWGKERTINKVWGAKKGSSQAYRQAEDEYEQIISQLGKEA